ncbi:unnamed protein product [Polarella glacialis]|uniref:Protein kinase domain-containing protein n=1 Tax=Polarella glacialis TaxID=89957 RepID=A0A813FDX9_POLGL|nr:unnamed protein product [Polarella glacialis]CAE8713913.1 unnamed protein product [Polarella glacialis]
MMLVFELIEGFTLSAFMSQQTDCPLVTGKLSIISGIASALQYIHSVRQPIVHGDLKDTHVFVEHWQGRLRSKLGDFGLARLVCGEVRMSDTLRWMAPEIVTSCGAVVPAASADTFSFGRLMSLVLSGQRPCAGLKHQEVMAMTLKSQLPDLAWPDEPLEVVKLSDFGKVCVQLNPLQRPTMQAATACIAACAESMPERFSRALASSSPANLVSFPKRCMT